MLTGMKWHRILVLYLFFFYWECLPALTSRGCCVTLHYGSVPVEGCVLRCLEKYESLSSPGAGALNSAAAFCACLQETKHFFFLICPNFQPEFFEP